MKVLWSLQKCSIKEVAEKMTEPKPAYNTIATVLKVLNTKAWSIINKIAVRLSRLVIHMVMNIDPKKNIVY